MFTVSAFAVGDRWASYSNFGNPPIDNAEPGSAIKSTWLSGGYNTFNGTVAELDFEEVEVVKLCGLSHKGNECRNVN